MANLALVGAAVLLWSCGSLDREVQHENQVRSNLRAECGAADARYMAAVQNPRSTAGEVMAARYASLACRDSLSQLDQIQLWQAERRLRAFNASRPAYRGTQDYAPDQPMAPVAMPEPSPPSLDLGDIYSHPAPEHGCVGQVPVSGPGFNPCPAP